MREHGKGGYVSLTSNELTYMREQIEDLLPDTCNLLTVTRTSDSAGGWSDTWGTATASVKCRLDAANGKEQFIADNLKPFHGFILTLPYNTTITTDYRVEISSTSYNVVAVDSGKSWSACLRAAVEKV